MTIPAHYVRKLNLKNDTINLTHGAGGMATAQLIEEIFAKHLTNAWLDEGHDGALLPPITHPVAVSCDAHVVTPLFFPGGDIGRLAVAGTVNDVAVCGAKPLYIAATFILEEGLSLSVLDRIVQSMAETAREAGVAVVTGDTKVVEKGHGDGIYISTTGIGEALVDYPITGRMARPGDAVLISGSMGDHGTTILGQREALSFAASVQSDTAPLNAMVQALLNDVRPVHVLRDPTRGGLAATLNEIAHQSEVGIDLIQEAIPVKPEVDAVCEFLGLDPLFVANEGKLIAIVPESEVDRALVTLRASPYGKDAARIGRITAENPGLVQMTTPYGGKRLIDWLNGEQLPRIC